MLKTSYQNLKAAWLENFLVFQVDDEPIFRVDTLAINSNFSFQLSSIVQASQTSKQKQEAESIDQLSTNIILFTIGFKKATTILDNTYCIFQSQPFELSVVPTVVTKVFEKRLN